MIIKSILKFIVFNILIFLYACSSDENSHLKYVHPESNQVISLKLGQLLDKMNYSSFVETDLMDDFLNELKRADIPKKIRNYLKEPKNLGLDLDKTMYAFSSLPQDLSKEIDMDMYGMIGLVNANFENNGIVIPIKDSDLFKNNFTSLLDLIPDNELNIDEGVIEDFEYRIFSIKDRCYELIYIEEEDYYDYEYSEDSELDLFAFAWNDEILIMTTNINYYECKLGLSAYLEETIMNDFNTNKNSVEQLSDYDLAFWSNTEEFTNQLLESNRIEKRFVEGIEDNLMDMNGWSEYDDIYSIIYRLNASYYDYDSGEYVIPLEKILDILEYNKGKDFPDEAYNDYFDENDWFFYDRYSYKHWELKVNAKDEKLFLTSTSSMEYGAGKTLICDLTSEFKFDDGYKGAVTHFTGNAFDMRSDYKDQLALYTNNGYDLFKNFLKSAPEFFMGINIENNGITFDFKNYFNNEMSDYTDNYVKLFDKKVNSKLLKIVDDKSIMSVGYSMNMPKVLQLFDNFLKQFVNEETLLEYASALESEIKLSKQEMMNLLKGNFVVSINEIEDIYDGQIEALFAAELINSKEFINIFNDKFDLNIQENEIKKLRKILNGFISPRDIKEIPKDLSVLIQDDIFYFGNKNQIENIGKSANNFKQVVKNNPKNLNMFLTFDTADILDSIDDEILGDIIGQGRSDTRLFRKTLKKFKFDKINIEMDINNKFQGLYGKLDVKSSDKNPLELMLNQIESLIDEF